MLEGSRDGVQACAQSVAHRHAEIAIGDLAQTIVRLVGRDLPIVTDEQRLRPEKSEVRRLLADNSRARDLLGWSPRTTLERGLSATIAWISEHMDRYQPGHYQV